MVNQIDHFMLAAPSLEEGEAWAEDTFGVCPAYGGEHLGLGTRNTLLSLGEVYLEIIVPDPTQDLAGTFGEKLSKLSEPGLVTWAVQGNLNEISAGLIANGMQSIGPKRTERRTAEGELLVWDLLFAIDGAHGLQMPFFIDWLDCPHPAAMNPYAGRFSSIQLTTLDANSLSRLLAGIDLDIEVTEGEPSMTVEIESNGLVKLTSNAETITLSLI